MQIFGRTLSHRARVPTLKLSGSPTTDRLDALVDGMLIGEVSDDQRRIVRDALSAYRLASVEQFHDAGIKIRFGPTRAGTEGLFGWWQKRVTIDPSGKHLRGTIIHEFAHAQSFLERSHSTPLLARLMSGRLDGDAAEHDKRLRQMYGDYLARSNVDLAARILSAVDTHAKDPEQALEAAISDPPLPMKLLYAPASLMPSGRTTVLITDPADNAGRSYLGAWAAGGSALSVAASLAGLIPVTPLETLAIGIIGGVGLYAHHWLGQRRARACESQVFDRTVTTSTGQSARVSMNLKVRKIEVDGPLQCGTAMWSHYATAARDVKEYYAEGVRMYLESPQTRQQLRVSDRAMYDYVASKNIAP